MEATPEEAREGSILVKVLAAVLERLVNSNTSIAKLDPGQVTKFHALKAPGIGVAAYLERVQKYASCSNECFILALIYIDRLIERNNFLMTALNVHRVVITAILLAAKFFDDAYYNNAYYAKVGGVLVSELNGLEVDFLFRINFSLHVSPELFEKYKAELVAHSINCGLVMNPLSGSSVPHQLPYISETESGSIVISSNNNLIAQPDFSQRRQLEQQHQQIQKEQQFSFPIENTIITTVPKQVTPSPSLSSEDVTDMVNGNGMMGMDTSRVQSSNETAVVQAQPRLIDQLHGSVSVISAPFQPLQVSQQQEQSILLHRANSLPFVSSGRCIDHAFKIPYSAPPMPATGPHVLAAAAVNQERYQLMMNQLFPIENTLIHHNHEGEGTASASNFLHHHQHHDNAAAAAAVAGLVGHHHHGGGVTHHPTLQVSWTGEIR